MIVGSGFQHSDYNFNASSIFYFLVNIRNNMYIEEEYYLSIAQQTVYFPKVNDLACLVERANNESIIKLDNISDIPSVKVCLKSKRWWFLDVRQCVITALGVKQKDF